MVSAMSNVHYCSMPLGACRCERDK